MFSHQYLSYDSTNPFVLGAQKNLTETILLSTNNNRFDCLIRDRLCCVVVEHLFRVWEVAGSISAGSYQRR